MSEWVRLCSRKDLPPSGEAREVQFGGKVYCLANNRGSLTLMDNVCPHRGGPLGQGLVEHNKLICPWHAWAFDLKTGEATNSHTVKVETFEIEMRGEEVFARL